MQNNILLFFIGALSLFLCISIFGCTKTNTDSSIKNPWDTCTNKFTKDINFRRGIWKRSQVGGLINPQGLNFKNDSILDILENINPDVWKYNVKYRMIPCNRFDHNKYWISPQLPNEEYWYSFTDVVYIDSTRELVMSYYYHGDIETIKFRKE